MAVCVCARMSDFCCSSPKACERQIGLRQVHSVPRNSLWQNIVYKSTLREGLCRRSKTAMPLRDWSLITGRGGYKTGGGAREVLPLRIVGAEKVSAMLKGRHKQFWGSFYAVA